jgi:hypothetical protein
MRDRASKSGIPKRLAINKQQFDYYRAYGNHIEENREAWGRGYSPVPV